MAATAKQKTFEELKDMGIEAPLAWEAASRFSNNTNQAVEWCFTEEGMNWKPKPPGALSPKPRPVPVSYAQSSMSSSQARPRTQAAIEARDPIPHIASQMVLDTEPNATFALASGSRSQTSGGVTVHHREVIDNDDDDDRSPGSSSPNTPPTPSGALPRYSDIETTPRAKANAQARLPQSTSTFAAIGGNPFTVNLPEVPKAPPSIFADKNPFRSAQLTVPKPPPLPPRYNQIQSQKQSINVASRSSSNPNTGYSSEVFEIDGTPLDIDGEDHDLAQAIALSKAGLGDFDFKDGDREENGGSGGGGGGGRQERERSVRASGAPPPSPDPEGGGPAMGNGLDGDGEAMQTLFGPSEKEDKDGSMAMVTVAPAWTQNSEDADLDRAIQDSLMTASFHSASAMKEIDKPEKKGREPHTPMVFYSESGKYTYAAHYLQAILSVPQLYEAILNAPGCPELEPLNVLLDAKWNNVNYTEVDECIRSLIGPPPSNQLSPIGVISVIIDFHQSIRLALQKSTTHPHSDDDATMGLTENDVNQIFDSHILTDPPRTTSHVNFQRTTSIPQSLYPMLSALLWTPEAPGQSIKELSDVLCFTLGWQYGAPREIWDLEETIVLDRFLHRNAGWSSQIRAEQSVAQGQVKRLKDKIAKLTTHKSNNFQDSLSTLVKHLESSSSFDEMQTAERKDIKAKLEQTLQILKLKVEELKLELEVEEKGASGKLFETSNPDLRRHVYTLRAVFFHDGALIPGNHLYVYIRQDDGSWWKIQAHEATKVDWQTIRTDKTGLYMDGGPYFFIYSREGPRPSRPVSIVQQPSSSTPSTIPSIELQEESLESSVMSSTATSTDTNLNPFYDDGTRPMSTGIGGGIGIGENEQSGPNQGIEGGSDSLNEPGMGEKAERMDVDETQSVNPNLESSSKVDSKVIARARDSLKDSGGLWML